MLDSRKARLVRTTSVTWTRCLGAGDMSKGDEPSNDTPRLSQESDLHIFGELAERLNAPVLKTGRQRCLGGSNPSLSAHILGEMGEWLKPVAC